MAIITTRDNFKAYCLRRLGAPVIEINIDDAQVEDRIDDAIQYWQDYHFDGLQKFYYIKHPHGTLTHPTPHIHPPHHTAETALQN